MFSTASARTLWESAAIGAVESEEPSMTTTVHHSVSTLFAAYADAWQAKDPSAIAALHTEDGVMQLHVGSPPAVGRLAVQQACVELFATLDYQATPTRTHFGADHWVLEWVMSVGEHTIDCVDVISVSPDGLVARKDGYVDAAQAAFLLAAP